jgi:hypothetical protein
MKVMEVTLIEQITLTKNELCALQISQELLHSMYEEISRDSEFEKMAKETADKFDEFMETLEMRHILN